MVLEALLDTIGLVLMAFGCRLAVAGNRKDDLWEAVKLNERNEGDTERVVAILLFFGALLLCAGIALALK